MDMSFILSKSKKRRLRRIQQKKFLNEKEIEWQIKSEKKDLILNYGKNDLSLMDKSIEELLILLKPIMDERIKEMREFVPEKIDWSLLSKNP